MKKLIMRIKPASGNVFFLGGGVEQGYDGYIGLDNKQYDTIQPKYG